MSGLCSPSIIVLELVQGGSKGQFVCSETQRILLKIMTVSLQTIQDECNSVAGGCRISWISKKPNEMMNENGYRLPGITYKDGLKELHPQFLLSCPSTIRISILDSRIDNSSDVCAAINDDDPPNPVLGCISSYT